MGSTYPDKPGRQLDINALLDMRVMVAVSHSVNGDKTYANITGLARVPRGMAPFNPTMDAFVWSYDDPADKRVPEWVTKFAAECIELGGVKAAPPTALDRDMKQRFDATRVSGHAVDAGNDDGIPF